LRGGGLDLRDKNSIPDFRVQEGCASALDFVPDRGLLEEPRSLRLQCEKLAIDAEVEELLTPQGGFLDPKRIISQHESRAPDIRLIDPAIGDGCDRTLSGRRARSLGIVKCGSREDK